MGIDDPIAGHMPQPEPERHRGIRQVVGKTPAGFDHHVLHDVAGIHPSSEHGIHSPIDDAPQRIPMPGKQAVDGIGIAVPNPVEQSERGRRSTVERP